MKNQNQKGITLIALVVTIVVLLILAGTSIAMLSGDNGIITNAQKSTAANTEGQVSENIKNAYNAVKTEIIAKASTDSSYDATTSATEQALALTVAQEVLGDTTLSAIPSSATKGYTIVYTAADHTVKITYSDSSFKDGGKVAGKTLGTIEATFTISSGNIALAWTNTPYFVTSY